MINTKGMAEKIDKEFKFGDLVRIETKNYSVTGFFRDIHFHYSRKKYRDATIVIYAKVLVNPDFEKFEHAPVGFWTYYLSEIDNITFLNRVLREDWLHYEETK